MGNALYFEIQADDLDRAAHFYTTVFGWQFEKLEGFPIEYRHIRAKNLYGGLLKRPAATPPPECGTNAFVCSFEVDDFDTTADIVEKLGGLIALPKFALPGSRWQGYFLDTEGNTFGIYQVDETAN